MPPDERRAALITATLPLLREHGLSVSTRQIAEAAGVAEGTIFGAFPDKRSLIHATILSAFDPAPIERSLSEIAPEADLHTRMRVITTIIARHLAENAPLFLSLRRARKTAGEGGGHADGHPPAGQPPGALLADLDQTRRRLVDAVTSAIEPHRSQLRLTPPAVAQLLLSMLAMNTRADRGDLDISPEEIITVLLDGLIVPSGPAPAALATAQGDPTPC